MHSTDFIIRYSLLFVSTLSIIGCTSLETISNFTKGTQVTTKIQVYSGLPDTAPLKFKYPDFNAIPLNVRAYYQLAARTLIKAGWVLSDSSNNILTLSTNINDGTSTNYSYSLPQYGQVATGSTTVNSKVTVNPYSNSATVKSTTVPKTTLGVTGYQTYSGTSTEFKRDIVISIINESSQAEMYRYELTSSGYSNDLNFVAPYMFSGIPIIHNKVNLCCGIYHTWKTQYKFTFTVGSESVYGKQFTW